MDQYKYKKNSEEKLPRSTIFIYGLFGIKEWNGNFEQITFASISLCLLVLK